MSPFETGVLTSYYIHVHIVLCTVLHIVLEGRFEDYAFISAVRRASLSAPSAGTSETRSLMRIKQNSQKVHGTRGPTNFLSARREMCKMQRFFFIR